MEPTSSEDVFRGRLFRVAVEEWPGAGRREIVHHPGACAVVALTAAGEVVLVRQFRPAVQRALLEIPAGVLDVAGEDAVTCAARELLEETGYHTSRPLEPLGSILTTPGFTDERIDLFLARYVQPGTPSTGEDEEIDVVLMSIDEARQAIEDGLIVDAKTVAALLRAS